MFNPTDYLFQGELRKYTSLGTYPILYLTHDSVLCPTCATADMAGDDPRVIAADINWEDPHLFCDDCGERIESAYTEDQAWQPIED